MTPQFATQKELHDWLHANKDLVIATKRATDKRGDAVAGGINVVPTGAAPTEAAKALGGVADAPAGGILYVKAVINTTGLLDSHGDVHIPGLWKKSLQETKTFLHLQEHGRGFKDVISNEVVAYTKSINWSALGYDFAGSTQALVFDSTIKAARNEYMYDQYAAGYVTNHSVGMRYVKMFMCVNSEEKWFREEKENWDKYYEQIVNKDAADETGYFWAVTEAKIVEGSAVLFGSNWATPTLEISGAGKAATPATIEPPAGTQTNSKSRFKGRATNKLQ